MKNPRVRSLKDKTLRYWFKMQYVPGSKNMGPDVTLRYPRSPLVSLEKTLVAFMIANTQDDLNMGEGRTVPAAAMLDEFKAITWDRLQEAVVCTEKCIALVEYLHQGFPSRKEDMPEELKSVWCFKDDL